MHTRLQLYTRVVSLVLFVRFGNCQRVPCSEAVIVEYHVVLLLVGIHANVHERDSHTASVCDDHMPCQKPSSVVQPGLQLDCTQLRLQ